MEEYIGVRVPHHGAEQRRGKQSVAILDMTLFIYHVFELRLVSNNSID